MKTLFTRTMNLMLKTYELYTSYGDRHILQFTVRSQALAKIKLTKQAYI